MRKRINKQNTKEPAISRIAQIQILRKKYRIINTLSFFISILGVLTIFSIHIPYFIPFDFNPTFFGILQIFVISILIIIAILSYNYKKEKKILPQMYRSFIPAKLFSIELFSLPLGIIDGIFIFYFLFFILMQPLIYPSIILLYFILPYSYLILRRKSLKFKIKFLLGIISFLMTLLIIIFFILPPQFRTFN